MNKQITAIKVHGGYQAMEFMNQCMTNYIETHGIEEFASALSEVDKGAKVGQLNPENKQEFIAEGTIIEYVLGTEKPYVRLSIGGKVARVSLHNFFSKFALLPANSFEDALNDILSRFVAVMNHHINSGEADAAFVTQHKDTMLKLQAIIDLALDGYREYEASELGQGLGKSSEEPLLSYEGEPEGIPLRCVKPPVGDCLTKKSLGENAPEGGSGVIPEGDCDLLAGLDNVQAVIDYLISEKMLDNAQKSGAIKSNPAVADVMLGVMGIIKEVMRELPQQNTPRNGSI